VTSSMPVALILLIAVTGIAARRPIGELMGAVYAGASRLLGIYL
jgi:hypothetical protein